MKLTESEKRLIIRERAEDEAHKAQAVAWLKSRRAQAKNEATEFTAMLAGKLMPPCRCYADYRVCPRRIFGYAHKCSENV